MSNMSYCRFQNTDKDLSDCAEALEGLLGTDPATWSRCRTLRAAPRSTWRRAASTLRSYSPIISTRALMS